MFNKAVVLSLRFLAPFIVFIMFGALPVTVYRAAVDVRTTASIAIYHATWCTACPKPADIAALQKTYQSQISQGQLIFNDKDVTNDPLLVSQSGITSLPTFFYFYPPEHVATPEKVEGSQSVEQISQKINQMLAAVGAPVPTNQSTGTQNTGGQNGNPGGPNDPTGGAASPTPSASQSAAPQKSGVLTLRSLIGSDPANLGIADLTHLIQIITKWAVGFSGTIALIYLMYGGLMYLSSAGDEGRTKKAKDAITWSVLGLLLILTSFAVITLYTKVIIKDPFSFTTKTAGDRGSQLPPIPDPSVIASQAGIPTTIAPTQGSSVGGQAVADRAIANIGLDAGSKCGVSSGVGCASFTSMMLQPTVGKFLGVGAPSHWPPSAGGQQFTSKSELRPGDEVFYTNDIVGGANGGIAAFDGDPEPYYKRGQHVPTHVGIYVGKYSGKDGFGGTIDCNDCVVQNSTSLGKAVVVSLKDFNHPYYMGGKHWTN